MSKLPDISVAQPGANNGGANKRELFQYESSAMIISNYQAAAVTDSHILKDQLSESQGKRTYHTGDYLLEYQASPGVSLTPQDSTQSYTLVSADNAFGANLVTSPWLDAQSEIASSERGRFVTKIGNLRAKLHDVVVFGLAVQAGSMASPVTGNQGGQVISAVGMTTTPAVFQDGVAQVLSTALQRGMPLADIRGFVSPEVARKVLWANKDLMNRDFDGIGSMAKGVDGMKIYGLPITVAPFLPTTNMTVTGNILAFGLGDPSGAPVLLTKYRADFSKVAAIFMTSDVVAQVTVQDVQVKYDELPQNLSVAVVVSWCNGYGVVNCAGAIILKEA